MCINLLVLKINRRTWMNNLSMQKSKKFYVSARFRYTEVVMSRWNVLETNFFKSTRSEHIEVVCQEGGPRREGKAIINLNYYTDPYGRMFYSSLALSACVCAGGWVCARVIKIHTCTMYMCPLHFYYEKLDYFLSMGGAALSVGGTPGQ